MDNLKAEMQRNGLTVRDIMRTMSKDKCRMSRKHFCKKGGRKARRAGTGGAGHGA